MRKGTTEVLGVVVQIYLLVEELRKHFIYVVLEHVKLFIGAYSTDTACAFGTALDLTFHWIKGAAKALPNGTTSPFTAANNRKGMA